MPEPTLSDLDHRILVTRILTTWQVAFDLQATILGWTPPDLQDALSATAPVPQTPEQLKRLLLTVDLIGHLHGWYGAVEVW